VLNCDSNGTEYHYSLSFDVAGIATNTAGSNVVDLSWRSFLIGQDFKVGNNTINAMLKDYLESRIVSLTQLPASETSPLPRVRRWYWNNQLRRPQEIGPLTSAALMFDFSSLNISLTSWSRPPAVPGSNSIQLQATTGFNLTFTEQITEVETIATFYTNAVYKLTTTINAPWGAVASRDSLNLESGWGVWLMVGVIVSSGGLFAGAFIFERRLQSKPRKSRK